MNNKTKVFIAIVLVACGTWFYFSPHLAVSQMKSAAEAKDAAKLLDYVNFPALKESLKASFNAKLASGVTKEKEGEDSKNLLIGIGAIVVLIVLVKLISMATT